jgi:hypothetical protein
MCHSRTALYAVLGSAACLIAACGGVSDLTKENVNRSETAVLQAQQAIGNSEQGAIELQRSREHLTSAKQAISDGDETSASRHAREAQLDAELAVAKAQSGATRKAADELNASIQTLREEAGRSGTELR